MFLNIIYFFLDSVVCFYELVYVVVIIFLGVVDIFIIDFLIVFIIDVYYFILVISFFILYFIVIFVIDGIGCYLGRLRSCYGNCCWIIGFSCYLVLIGFGVCIGIVFI